jgi:hypothetical protein
VWTGATFADASAEWLRWAEHERACKPTTLTDYRYTVRRLDDAFGETRLEDVTAGAIERWKATVTVSNRTIRRPPCVLARGGMGARARRLVA